jgi:hypothetical protein
VLGSGFVVGDKVPIGPPSRGIVLPDDPVGDYSENGVDLRSASSMTNVVDGEVVVSTPGLHTFTVTYRGQSNGVYLAFAVSSTTVTVDVAGPPPGRPVTGQIAIGAHTPAALGAETRLTGAAFDPVTGAIGAGSFWFPQAELSVPAPIVGSAPVRYRLMQLAPTTGQVDSDGSVSFTPTAFALEAREAQIFGSWSNLGACTFSPIPLELSGTADAGGLHLTATSGPFPPVPVNGCGGYASYVNPELAAGATFTFDVTGDFAGGCDIGGGGVLVLGGGAVQPDVGDGVGGFGAGAGGSGAVGVGDVP